MILSQHILHPPAVPPDIMPEPAESMPSDERRSPISDAGYSAVRRSMRKEESLSRRNLLGMLVASAAGGWLMFRMTQNQVSVDVSAESGRVATSDAASKPDPKVVRAAFYDAEVEPKVFETDQMNREAADRVVERLRDTFRQYQAGVKAFVSDLTSVSTRLGIVKRMPGQWWAGDQRIDEYVREKFEKHLFSEQKLLDDIGAVITTFQEEIDVNQRRMLTEIRASLSASDMPQVSMSTYEEFYDQVAKKLQTYSTSQGSATVYNALTVLIVSEAGSYVATSLIAGLLARFGTAAAVSTVAASGAAAGSATVGAGGGTLGGPVGVVVGFGVGLAVGLVIDWWMTDKFETEMSLQMNGYLASLQHAILYGDSIATDDSTREGLVGALPIVCDRLLDAYRERFYAQIVTGDSL